MDRKRFQEIWEDGLHHRSFVAGGILTVLMLSLAILSLIWTPYSVFTMNIAGKLQPRVNCIGWEPITSVGMCFQC